MAIKILKQNEDGSYQWVNLTTGSGGGGGSLDELEVDYTDNNNTSNYTGDKSLVVTTPQTGTKRINIQYEGSVGANAYGRKYVQNSEPTSPNNGDIWYDTSGDVASSGITRIATIKDQRQRTTTVWPPADTAENGGDAAHGPNIRKFNTIHDPKGIGITLHNTATIGNGFATVIKVPAGTYRIRWSAPAWDVGLNNTVFQYSTSDSVNVDGRLNSSVTSVQGSSEFAATDATAGGTYVDMSQTNSIGVIASITFTQDTYFQLSHWCDQAQDTFGLGSANYTSNAGDSVFAQVEIEDLATAIKDAAPAPADVPIGGIIMWSGTKTALDALTNWVMCDDSAAAVAAGAPDLRDKFIIGAHSFSDEGDGKWETNVTGSGTQSGGNKDAIVGSHKHTFGIYSGGDDHGGSKPQRENNAGGSPTVVSVTNAKDTSSGNVIGEDVTNKNLPPYWALAYIMKIS